MVREGIFKLMLGEGRNLKVTLGEGGNLKLTW
jgi:hypothetical protein